ncbi:ENOX2 [Cordylochernes scorpioides]|uniref:ENOX2 n=1 Tax=Cordylochernes scorpioides TaxID=51811 RepID=A0ABY6KW53_9ARAC|nr:ENOX2 [Cordylochernes scorpioides]
MMAATGDPSLYSMMGVTNYSQKEVLTQLNCADAPVRTTQERPPGCRTVFVGGLPENSTEEMMVEIFQRCGEIQTIRMNKKNFCHIRFMDCSYVDNAIFLSGEFFYGTCVGAGYRMVVNGEQEASGNTGWLHVDYAQARDDQYEWECQQRALERELRHRERDHLLRPPSPPPVPHYSDYEASSLIERLRTEDSFPKAVSILVTWLERGECSKKNAPQFYSMIQSTNCNVRRLMSDKVRFEQELTEAKLLLKQRLSDIIGQFSQIEKVFAASAHQKVWDHFTKAQRKNIDLWKKQAKYPPVCPQEIKNAQMEEILNEREEDEMDMSDQEDSEWGPISKKARLDSFRHSVATGESILREENDALRCQLEAYRNEVEVLKVEMQGDQTQSANRQQIQHLQQQLLALSQQRAKDNQLIDQLQATVKVLQERKRKPKVAAEAEKKKEETEAEEAPVTEEEEEPKELPAVAEKEPEEASPLNMEITSTSTPSIPSRDAILIGIISTFLNVHPKGASVDYLWSYLQQLDPLILHRDIEALLSAYPSVFSQEIQGVGASLERRWTFVGFKSNGFPSL